MYRIEHYCIKDAYSGLDDECGDTCIIEEFDTICFFALVDVLGHGRLAAEVAVFAEEYLRGHHDLEPVALIQGLHETLKGTRGAVAAVCRLDRNTGRLRYSGMGNINLRIYGSRMESLVTRDGVLGYMIPTPNQGEVLLAPGDIFVMCSDGIRVHFDPAEYPDLFLGQAKNICARFLKYLRKADDDASCIVLRYGI